MVHRAFFKLMVNKQGNHQRKLNIELEMPKSVMTDENQTPNVMKIEKKAIN